MYCAWRRAYCYRGKVDVYWSTVVLSYFRFHFELWLARQTDCFHGITTYMCNHTSPVWGLCGLEEEVCIECLWLSLASYILGLFSPYLSLLLLLLLFACPTNLSTFFSPSAHVCLLTFLLTVFHFTCLSFVNHSLHRWWLVSQQWDERSCWGVR